eukprot:Nitzschia sp. Nitz4//scaffold43_size134323//49665//51521//NITZ4_003296-RA/size134323-processed-gene-0.44-mRNA-1//-1//CDS//3329551939//7473//frame0
MLRVMKLKMTQESCFGFQQESDDSNTPDTGGEPSQPVVITQIPASLGTRSVSSSANSSISSTNEYTEIGNTESKPPKMVTASPLLVKDINQDASVDSPDESSGSEGISLNNTASRVPLLSDKELPITNEENKRKSLARRVSMVEDSDTDVQGPPKKARTESQVVPSSNLVLLAQSQDESTLSPLHAFVRKQIEVFMASPVELQQPAPGRKQPIKLHQVGLRCIHCRHQPSRQRVKRAVCYPTSVGRVYHSVSDMKFDHFSNCKDMPADVRAVFDTLKNEGKRNTEKKSPKSTSTSTAQYYHDAACRMGMIDGNGGIFFSSSKPNGVSPAPVPPVISSSSSTTHTTLAPRPEVSMGLLRFPLVLGNEQGLALRSPLRSNMLSTSMLMNVFANTANHNQRLQVHDQQDTRERLHPSLPPRSTGSQAPESQVREILAEDSDKEHLNDLHCFVRKHVEIFTADSNDIAAPAPGRKARVQLGQVGIRCIHCARLPNKARVKRAVCYPPSVSGIYHSVSNMKFDHFGICKGLPPQAREEFSALKDSCSRRGSSGNNGSRGGSSSSTSKYYQDSASRKGLVDTDCGIRFGKVLAAPVEDKPALSVRTKCADNNFLALVHAASQAA